MEAQVNLWAVLLATLSSMVVGSLWYSKAVFGKTWFKLARITQEGNGDVVRPILTAALMSFVAAYVLATLAFVTNSFYLNTFLQDTLTASFWVWLAFAAGRFITHDAFEGRPFKLTLINISYEFVTIMIMGLVIGLMGVN